MGTTEGNPKTETDSNAYNLVIKVKPQRQNREGIQPGTGLLRLNSQESSSLPVASCRVQQLLLFRFNVVFIPCTQVLFHYGGGWGLLVSLLPLTANLQDVWGVVAFTLFEGIWIKRSLHQAADTKKADRAS